MAMGSGDHKHHHHHHNLKFHVHMHLPFHLQHHGHEEEELKDIPKGSVAVLVGQGEQQRFVIPVVHINHPLFIQLLKGAEEEYEYYHNGPINIPCHVEEFRYVEGMIDKDNNNTDHHNYHHNHGHLWCFKA